MEMKQTIPSLSNLADSFDYSWNGFSRFTHRILILYCLSAGLSIAASQILLGGILIYWIALWVKDIKNGALSMREFTDPQTTYIFGAMGLWLLCAFCSTFFGVAPSRAFPEFLKTFLYLQFPFVVLVSLREADDSVAQTLKKIQTYLLAMGASMGLAAIHTSISLGISPDLLARTPGSLTESGQLVLIIPAVLTLYMLWINSKGKRESFSSILIGLLVFVCFLLFVWPEIITKSVLIQYIGGGVLLAAIAVAFRNHRLGNGSLVTAILLGLLFGALMVNLKRGPWLGIMIELVLLGFLYSRKLLLAAISGSTLLLLLEPARNRIFSLIDHFVIDGGRLDMWTLGTEIAARYPLGLGFDNAVFMRSLDPSIPPTHRHMHNNLLNITVETGWLGLAAYIWWIYLMLALAYRLAKCSNRNIAILASGLGVALLGWQVSGLVEYNFGDGEINMVAMFFMGLLLILADLLQRSQSRPKA
jgi:hypothetical protein